MVSTKGKCLAGAGGLLTAVFTFAALYVPLKEYTGVIVKGECDDQGHTAVIDMVETPHDEWNSDAPRTTFDIRSARGDTLYLLERYKVTSTETLLEAWIRKALSVGQPVCGEYRAEMIKSAPEASP